MAEITHYALTPRQHASFLDLLGAYESGTFWPSDRPLEQLRYKPENHIRFHNDSGEAIPPFAVMRITGVNSAGAAPWRVKVGKPNTTFYNVYLVNGPAICPVSDNSWGTYLFDSGHVLCDSTYVPTVGQEWGPKSGQWSLVRHRPGFLIDGGPTGSGATYRAVAKQRIVTTLRGDLATALAYGGTATMDIWFRNAATGAREDAGMQITVHDFFHSSGDSWPATTRVLVNFESGIWTVDQAKCDPDSGGGGGGGGGGAASQSGSHLGTNPGLYPNGFDANGAQLFSGSVEGKDYDSLFNSA